MDSVSPEVQVVVLDGQGDIVPTATNILDKQRFYSYRRNGKTTRRQGAQAMLNG